MLHLCEYKIPPPLCFISGDELEKNFLLYVAYCIELCHSNPLQEQWSLSLYIVSFHVLYSEVLKIMIWEFKVHHCWRKFWCTKPVQIHFVGQNSHSQSFMSLLSALKSKNTVVPFTISVFLQLCVCVLCYEIINGSSYFWHCTSHPVWVTSPTGLCYESSPLGGYQYFSLKCFLYL